MAVQIRPEQERRLADLAMQSGLSAEEFLQLELDSFLDYQEDLARLAKRGDEDIAAGRVVTQDDVVARVEKLLKGQ